MILSSKVIDMQNSYSSSNIFPRESPICVYQEMVKIIFFLASGFKSNSKLRTTQVFINRKMDKKNCGHIEWKVI